jgi:predicted dehydrogenase
MPYRVAVVGAGRWGRVLINSIMRLEELALRRVVTTQSDLGETVGPGCIVSAGWNDMLADPEIEGVIVATPPATHYAIAAGALAAGKAVLIEKPLTLNVDEAERLLSQAKACGGRVLVDHTHLFNPAYRRLRALLVDAGPIRAVNSHGGAWGPFRQGHPVLWDWASHDVALCLDVLGELPVEAAVVGVRNEKQPDGPGGRYELRLDFGSGAVAHIETGNLMPHKQRRFDDLHEPKLSVRDVKAGSRDVVSGDIDYTDEMPVDRLLKEFTALGRWEHPREHSLLLGVEVVRVLARLDEIVAAGAARC